MNEGERRECEELARDYVRDTGCPLIVPPSLAKLMREAGIDMTNVRENVSIPRWPQ